MCSCKGSKQNTNKVSEEIKKETPEKKPSIWDLLNFNDSEINLKNSDKGIISSVKDNNKAYNTPLNEQ
jgi:hypothetical protein